MGLYISQLERAEKRYENNTAQRKRRREGLRKGDWRSVDSADRIRTRAASLGLDDLVEQATPGRGRGLSGKKAVILEAIISESQLRGISVLYKLAAASRAVARLEIRMPVGGIIHHGTGFLISPSLLMTNNHVLWDPQLALASLAQFDYYQHDDLSVHSVAVFHMDPARFFVTSTPLDFTLVALSEQNPEGRDTSEFGHLRLIAASGKAIVGERVNIIQHPAGRPKEVSFRENLIVDRVDDFLQYETDTQKGSSGAPVLDDKNCELAALHHAGVPVKNKNGKILLRDGRIWDESKKDEDKIAYRANEGTRISSIVEHVKGLSLGESKSALFAKAFEPPPPPERVLASLGNLGSESPLFNERLNVLSAPSARSYGNSPEPGPVMEADGSVSWMLRVNVGFSSQPPIGLPITAVQPESTVSVGELPSTNTHLSPQTGSGDVRAMAFSPSATKSLAESDHTASDKKENEDVIPSTEENDVDSNDPKGD